MPPDTEVPSPSSYCYANRLSIIRRKLQDERDPFPDLLACLDAYPQAESDELVWRPSSRPSPKSWGIPLCQSAWMSRPYSNMRGTAGYQRSLCIPTGTGYNSPEAYCNGNVGVPRAPHLMPVPMGKEADSKRSA